jgi:predicted nucleic-acid-binding protein
MIGLDTNVLLRYLAQDDPVQSPRATEIIRQRLTKQDPGFISLVAILEVVWVLKSLYKRSRQESANDVEMVLAADTHEVHNEQEVYHAVVALRNGAGTFEDALIGSLGIWKGVFFHTHFRRKGRAKVARFLTGMILGFRLTFVIC